MLTVGLAAMTLVRLGFARGLGLFPMLILLAVVGGIVWALTRPSPSEQSKG